MKKLDPSVAQQIAQAASAFEQRRTGHTPQSVAVILSENTLVITLHGVLSPAEKALAKSPAGAAQVQEFHRQLFIDSADSLREEIKRITGVEVREATAEVEPTSGTVVQVFYDRHGRAGVPARQRRGRGQLERERIRRVITKKGGFAMLVLSRKNQRVGRDRRVRWVSSPAESHGARHSRHPRETGLRGRCRCSRPSVGGVGTNPAPRPVRSPDRFVGHWQYKGEQNVNCDVGRLFLHH